MEDITIRDAIETTLAPETIHGLLKQPKMERAGVIKAEQVALTEPTASAQKGGSRRLR